MAAIRERKVIDPETLSAAAREQLVDDLYAIQCSVFDGVDRADFAKYVVYSSAASTWIELLLGEEGRTVGYFALHRFDRSLDGRTVSIFRAEAGILRAYRGGGSLGSLFMRKALPYRLAHPTRSFFYLGSLVHPSSYLTLDRVTRTLYPRRDVPTPPSVLELMCTLGDEFGLATVDPAVPLVRQVGWITRDTEVEQAYWAKCDKPAARFFIEVNPRYVDGDGLLTLIPLDFADLCGGIYRYLRRKVSRRWGRIHAAVQRVLPTMRRLSPKALEALIRGVPLLQGLDDGARRLIAQSAVQTIVPPGRYLFHRGDRGNAMHMIASGAAYVVLEAEGDRPEIILDELVRGEVVGEMSLLSGEPRTASIRAAATLSLVTVDKATFDGVLRGRPALAEVAWTAFTRRRLDAFLSDLPRFAHLGRADRERWAAHGEPSALKPGETMELGSMPYVFVAQGAVELAHGDTWQLANAPTLIVRGGPMTATAGASGARLLQLPEWEERAPPATEANSAERPPG